MFRFMQRFGRDRQTRGRGTGPMTRVRRRNRQLNCEALESRQLLSGYYIVNQASGKVLDNSLSTVDGTVIDQWQLYGGTNQQWNLVPQANGTDEIQNAQSGMALTATSGSEGTQIVQVPWLGGYLAQEWTVSLGAGQVGNGNSVNVGFKNAYSGMWLDNPQSSQSNGTPTIQWPLDYGANQKWTLLAADPSFSPETMCINNTANGDPLLGEFTFWTVVPLADGYDLFVNASTGEVLDDPDFSTSDGGIQQYQLNGGLNQQWQQSDAGSIDGVEAGIVIRNAYSGLVLDDPTGNPTSQIQDQELGLPSLTQCWEISYSYPAY